MGDEDELIGNDFLSLGREHLKNISTYLKSEKNRVLSQGIFENYVLATQSDNHVYKNFLQKIQNPDEVSEQVVFQKPSNLLLQGYLLYMLDGVDVGIGHVKGRNNKYNSVRTRLAGVSGTYREFGLSQMEYNHHTDKLLTKLSGKFNDSFGIFT